MMTWFDRLCDRINPPMPDALQARMLREVQTRYHEMRGGNATWYPNDGTKTFRIWLTNADFEPSRMSMRELMEKV